MKKKSPSIKKVRSLTPDELGRLGEDLFRKMCTQARLLAHAPSADRWGWDFLIEESGAEVAVEGDLAARPVPLQRLVQVKTVWEGAREVNLRLSAAERLGKIPNPSFLCVLEMSESLDPVRMHVMHMHGALLEGVLRRLREMQASGRSTRINRVEFRVPLPKAAAGLLPTYEVLRQALDEPVGPDADAYLKEKAAFLKEAGFPERRISGTFKVRTESDDDYAEFLLGNRPLEVVDFEAAETRWNITIPLSLPGQPVSVRLVPTPWDVELVWRRLRSPSAVRMMVKALVVPDPSGDPERDRIVITHPNFEFRIQGPTFTITVKGPDTVPMGYRDLVRFHALEAVFAFSEPVEMQMLFRGRQIAKARIDESLAFRPRENTAALGLILQELETVLSFADIHDVKMLSRSWRHWREQLRSLHAMLTEPSSVTGALTVAVPQEFKDDLEEREALYISALQFDDGLLAYYAVSSARLAACENPGQRQMKFRDFAVRELRFIDPTDEAMNAFVAEAKATTGLTTSLVLWGEEAEGMMPEPVVEVGEDPE
ncbi:hypothetical protein [Muricoccus aerilatus]|uniref:hypothetical protein n=1 Tax=Muricoccus aerilatus TaxID=452982 RepID=UPI0005C234F7|nr:hypothetical protein [Roseomonas aerilata]